jgi:hypothetical protein
MLDIFTPIHKGNDQDDDDLMHYMVQVGSYEYPINRKLGAVLDKIASDKTVHWVSGGAWSAIDLFMGIIAKTGTAMVWISSYAFSEKPARTIADLVHDGTIEKLECIIDSRVDTRSASALTLIQNCSKRCVLLDTHAKVTLITNGTDYYTIVGSANYTTNKRWEAGIVCMDKDTFNFHLKWMQHAMDTRNTD